jgi:hypothetical protein
MSMAMRRGRRPLTWSAPDQGLRPAAMKKLLEKYVGEDWTLAEVTKTARRILGLDDRESDKDSIQ